MLLISSKLSRKILFIMILSWLQQSSQHLLV